MMTTNTHSITQHLTTIVRKPERTIYLGLEKVVHRANCMNGLHLARDINVVSHCLVPDELKEALSATGEWDMFYRPEDLPILKAP